MTVMTAEVTPASPADLLDRCMKGEVDGAVAIRALALDSIGELVEFVAPDGVVTFDQFNALADAWHFYLEHRKA